MHSLTLDLEILPRRCNWILFLWLTKENKKNCLIFTFLFCIIRISYWCGICISICPLISSFGLGPVWSLTYVWPLPLLATRSAIFFPASEPIRSDAVMFPSATVVELSWRHEAEHVTFLEFNSVRVAKKSSVLFGFIEYGAFEANMLEYVDPSYPCILPKFINRDWQCIL